MEVGLCRGHLVSALTTDRGSGDLPGGDSAGRGPTDGPLLRSCSAGRSTCQLSEIGLTCETMPAEWVRKMKKHWESSVSMMLPRLASRLAMCHVRGNRQRIHGRRRQRWHPARNGPMRVLLTRLRGKLRTTEQLKWLALSRHGPEAPPCKSCGDLHMRDPESLMVGTETRQTALCVSRWRVSPGPVLALCSFKDHSGTNLVIFDTAVVLAAAAWPVAQRRHARVRDPEARCWVIDCGHCMLVNDPPRSNPRHPLESTSGPSLHRPYAVVCYALPVVSRLNCTYPAKIP